MTFTGINYVLVKLKGRYNEHLETANGLKLYRPTSRGTEQEFMYAHEDNICGEVVGACTKSGNRWIGGYNNGFPKYVKGSNPDRVPSGDYYVCTSYSDEPITTQGNQVEVQEGDTVYFMRGAIKDENFLQREADGSLLLLVEYSSLFLRIRNGKTDMLGMYCMAEPYYDEDVQDHNGVMGKKLVYGSLELILPSDGRKIQHGKLLAVGAGINQMPMPEVEPNDVVLYEPKAEFENEIEGKKVFIFYAADIMAKLVNNQLIPLGDFVSIKPDRPKVNSSLFIPQAVLDKQKVNVGEVTGVGSFVADTLIGDKVQYNKNTPFEGQPEILVHQDQIFLRYEQ